MILYVRLAGGASRWREQRMRSRSKFLGSLLSGTIGEIGFKFSLIMFTRTRA